VPTYAYACTACKHRFEIVQSFSESSLTDCPKCQGRLRKLFNAVGIVFKGSGFYSTDSRKSSRQGSGKVSRSDSSRSSRGDSGSPSVPVPSSESGGPSSGSSSSKKSAGSSASTGTTKTATKSALRSEDSAA